MLIKLTGAKFLKRRWDLTLMGRADQEDYYEQKGHTISYFNNNLFC